MSEFEKIGVVTDFAEGVLNARRLGNQQVVVVKYRGRIFALSNVCTHAGFTLAPGELIGDLIDCPVHGARFGLDGSVSRGPADEGLETYTVRIEGEDVLLAQD